MAPAPLTEMQTLRLANLLLARDLAQARLDAIVKELTIPGWTLMGDGTYVKTPEPPTVTP